MRNLKKVGCLILCLALMMSVAVFNVGAAFSDQKDIQHTEAVGMCTSLNIIGGYPDGSYKPAGNITRAEMCKMVCVALNGGNAPVLGNVTKHTFSDVQTNQNSAWAEPYIESCAAQGIVSGVGNGMFAPSGSITGSQAAKMLLVALGYKSTQENFTGASWEVNVNVRASTRGLYKELDGMNPSLALTRDNAAQMIWNALKADEVEYKSTLEMVNGQLASTLTLQDKVVGSNSDKIDLMTDKYATVDTDYTTGTLEKFEYNSTKKEFTYYLTAKDNNDETDSNGKTVPASYKSTTDYTAMLGEKVCFVAKDKDTVYGAYAKDSQVVLTGKVGDLPKLKASDTNFKVDNVKYELDNTNVGTTPVYYFQNDVYMMGQFDKDGKVTALDKAYAQADTAWAQWYVNGATSATAAPRYLSVLAGTAGATNVDASKTTGDNVKTYDAQNFKAVDFDGDGDIDYFIVMPTIVGKVSYVSGTDFKVKSATVTSKVTDKLSTGDVNAYTGLAKDDYVAYTPSAFAKDDTDTVEKATTVSGKITSVDSSDVYIDGTWYTYDVNYDTNPAVSTTLTDAAVYNGYIFDADSSNKKSVSDYAVLMAKDNGGVNGNQVKLLFSDGTKKVVDAQADYTTWANGTLVTYSKNSDSEYKLTKADTSDTGFDAAAGASVNAIATYYATAAVGNTGVVTDGLSVTKVSNSSTKAGYINTYTIADDAVIFVAYDKAGATSPYSYSYKVITGAQMKKMTASQFTGAYLLATKESSSSNTYNVNMAYVYIDGSVNDADTYYGYITAVASVENKDGDKVRQVTVWTKDGEKKYLTDTLGDTEFDKLVKRNVIEYKLNADGEISEIVNSYDVDNTTYTASTADKDGAATIAVTSWNSTLQFKTLATTDATVASGDIYTYLNNVDGGKYYEPDDDIVYLYIENTDAKGVSSGTITKADDAETANTLVPNAFVMFDNEGNILLIVYDMDNEIAE